MLVHDGMWYGRVPPGTPFEPVAGDSVERLKKLGFKSHDTGDQEKSQPTVTKLKAPIKTPGARKS